MQIIEYFAINADAGTRRPQVSLPLLYQQKKRELLLLGVTLSSVVPPGIEPGTQGFSVLCSTN